MLFSQVEEDHYDARLKVKIPTSYLREAGIRKREYDSDIAGIMKRHALVEAEVVSGVSVKESKKRKRREKDTSMKVTSP